MGNLKLTTGSKLIAKERQRQIEKEGWTPEHDAEHTQEELSTAASCYAMPGDDRLYVGDVPENWPWDSKWWKPADCEFSTDDNYKEERVKELAKAGALIAAEIDRFITDAGLVDEETSDEELEALTDRNASTIGAFMDHCKSEGLEIDKKYFESYFNA